MPPPLQELRKDSVHLLQGLRRSERLPLHWGMTMAVYPFWRVVADVTGRLFRLQGTAAPMQVQRRVKELLGEIRKRLSKEELSIADQRAAGRDWKEIAAEQGASPESLRKQLARAVEAAADDLELAHVLVRLGSAEPLA